MNEISRSTLTVMDGPKDNEELENGSGVDIITEEQDLNEDT